MKKRPSKIKSWMNQIKEKAKESHDEHTEVGCIIIDEEENVDIVAGYNGFVREAPDEDLPKTRPEKYEYMIHAEENAVLNAARLGRSVKGATAICTLSPCTKCTRALYQAGVSRVIFEEKYRTFEPEVLKMKDIEVIEKGRTPDGYYIVEYVGRGKGKKSSR